MNHDTFLSCNLPQVVKLETSDQMVKFYTNKQGLKHLQELKVEFKYCDYLKHFFNKLLREHLIVTISLLLIVLMLICSQYFVREIVFADPLAYNYEVYQTVNRHLVKRGPFFCLDADLNTIGQELRTTYYDYAYIGLIRDGSKIIIEIAKQEIPKIDHNHQQVSGDLIAKMDGYIVGLEIKKGITMITINQMVKKGTPLVSGNLLYLSDPTSREHTLPAEGMVLAKTYEYLNVIVPKEQVIKGYTGTFESHLQVTIGTFKFGEKYSGMIDGYQSIKDLFKIPKLIKFQKIITYEQSDILITHNEVTSQAYAISKIYYNFSLSKRSTKEVINEITILRREESATHYEYYFLVKATQNIAEFQSYS